MEGFIIRGISSNLTIILQFLSSNQYSVLKQLLQASVNIFVKVQKILNTMLVVNNEVEFNSARPRNSFIREGQVKSSIQ